MLSADGTGRNPILDSLSPNIRATVEAAADAYLAGKMGAASPEDEMSAAEQAEIARVLGGPTVLPPETAEMRTRAAAMKAADDTVLGSKGAKISGSTVDDYVLQLRREAGGMV